MKIFDYKNEPNYDGWASMNVWPLKCAIDLIAANMTTEFKGNSGDKFQDDFSGKRSLVSQTVALGINSGDLACEKYIWDSDIEDEEYSPINTMIDKDAFLRFVKGRGFPVHQTLWASVKPEEPKEPKLRSNQETKLLCQGIAIALWEASPEMTIAEMAKQELILQRGGGKIYSEKALREWLAEVDPRSQDKKRGPKGQ